MTFPHGLGVTSQRYFLSSAVVHDDFSRVLAFVARWLASIWTCATRPNNPRTFEGFGNGDKDVRARDHEDDQRQTR